MCRRPGPSSPTVAALLTADNEPGAFIAWFAGPHGAVGSGLLLVVVGQLYARGPIPAWPCARTARGFGRQPAPSCGLLWDVACSRS